MMHEGVFHNGAFQVGKVLAELIILSNVYPRWLKEGTALCPVQFLCFCCEISGHCALHKESSLSKHPKLP